jgi:hypothetical protein
MALSRCPPVTTTARAPNSTILRAAAFMLSRLSTGIAASAAASARLGVTTATRESNSPPDKVQGRRVQQVISYWRSARPDQARQEDRDLTPESRRTTSASGLVAEHPKLEGFHPAVGEKGQDGLSQHRWVNRVDGCHPLSVLDGQCGDGRDTITIVRTRKS